MCLQNNTDPEELEGAIETDPKHVEKADTLEARGNYVRPSDRLKRE